MVDISEASTFTAAITRIETSDLVLGGNEISSPNRQLKQIIDRTRWLKDQVDALIASTGGLVIGTDVQAWDADLDALSALNGVGLVRRTAPDTYSLVQNWINQRVCNGRLSLNVSNPVVDASGSIIYFHPFNGNTIALYNGTEWIYHTFTSINIDVSALTVSTVYDIFIYDVAGTLTLEAVAWVDDTTRTSPLVLQDGVYVKNGDNTRRWLGTFYIEADNTVSNTQENRSLWNYYNQVDQLLFRADDGPWNTTTQQVRPANNDAANRLSITTGLDQVIDLKYITEARNKSNAQVLIGFGQDTTTTINFTFRANAHHSFNEDIGFQTLVSSGPNIHTAGRHFYTAIEDIEIYTTGVGSNLLEVNYLRLRSTLPS